MLRIKAQRAENGPALFKYSSTRLVAFPRSRDVEHPDALGIVRARCFLERVALGDGPVFGATAARAPTAAPNLEGKGHIERRPVYPGLSAGDDLFDRSHDSATTGFWREAHDAGYDGAVRRQSKPAVTRSRVFV
jgi:hypothetical protein